MERNWEVYVETTEDEHHLQVNSQKRAEYYFEKFKQYPLVVELQLNWLGEDPEPYHEAIWHVSDDFARVVKCPYCQRKVLGVFIVDHRRNHCGRYYLH